MAAVDLLTTNETMERLEISFPTLYKLVYSGRLETVTIGKRRFFPKQAVEHLKANGPRDPRGRKSRARNTA